MGFSFSHPPFHNNGVGRRGEEFLLLLVSFLLHGRVNFHTMEAIIRREGEGKEGLPPSSESGAPMQKTAAEAMSSGFFFKKVILLFRKVAAGGSGGQVESILLLLFDHLRHVRSKK